MIFLKNVNDVIVMYNNQIVGRFKALQDNRIAFQYDEYWLVNGFSISPFSLPLSNKIYISKYDPFDGLFGVFYDSLPDGWGELLLNKMLMKNNINPNKISPLTKLTLIDDNCLGGLNYLPSNYDQFDNDDVYEFDTLYKLSKKLLNDKDDVNIDALYKNGGSSGGTRPKVNAIIDNEHWIVKFPSKFDSDNVSKEEYLANKIAKECGINIPEFRLIKSKVTNGYFASKRFDRVNGRRIHTISLSSLLETSYQIPNLDYMHLFNVIKKISVNKEEDLYEAYKRMCFNVFSYNKDDHGKNFSFIYDENRNGYVLSPSYDNTILYNKFEHEMTVLGNGNPDKKELLELAKMQKLSIKKCNEIIDLVIEKCKVIRKSE